MDIQKEREAFDAYFKEKYPELYKDVFDEDGDDRAIIGYSFAWSAWQAAKSQAVPEGFEIGRLQDRITELLDERQELYAQLNTGTTKGFTLVQKDLIQSIHQSCVNSLIAESMPAFKAVANTIIYELSPMVKAIQVEAQEQSHE